MVKAVPVAAGVPEGFHGPIIHQIPFNIVGIIHFIQRYDPLSSSSIKNIRYLEG